MHTKVIEAAQKAHPENVDEAKNWGKFLVGRFDVEWVRRSEVSPYTTIPLLAHTGWGPAHFLVLDLQTGEGFVTSKGFAAADLEKHAVWVCPLFKPFLEWLYQQDLRNLDALPDLVELPDAEFKFSEPRNPGKGRDATP